jgi:hypothetical protein
MPRRLLSTGASPLVCLSFAGWLSHCLLSRASASRHISSGSRRMHPSSTPPLCSCQLVVALHLFAPPPPLDAPVPLPALLNLRLQCGRPRIGRRRRRPSNDDALLPAPHRCTAAAAPTTLHSHGPSKGAIADILQTPHHQRFARRKASEGVRRPPPPSFDCCVCAASQSAIVADIERPRRH